MQLLFAHMVLIGAAFSLAVGFGVRALLVFLRHGASIDGALSIASLVIAVGLALYFRTVRARWKAAKQPPPPG
ncbi:MAG: hypothetical protein ABI193_20730 [Minicystis sp.]